MFRDIKNFLAAPPFQRWYTIARISQNENHSTRWTTDLDSFFPVLDGYSENRTTDIGNVTSQILFFDRSETLLMLMLNSRPSKNERDTDWKWGISRLRIQSRPILKKHRFLEIIFSFFFFLNSPHEQILFYVVPYNIF